MVAVTTGHRVINSAAIFTCAHAYVAIGKRCAPLFVCTLCSYRTEELPLPYKLVKGGQGNRERPPAMVLVMPPRTA